MTPLRSKALAALRDGRVAVLLADCSTLAPHVVPPARVTAFVTSSRSDPANPTGYFVDYAGTFWTCSCRGDRPCPHVAAVQMVTGHPSPAAKEATS